MPVEHVFRSNVLALEDAIRDPEVQIGGLVVLLDMAGLGFSHARYLSPHLAKRTVEVVQEGFPMRFKAFHVLHEPFYMDAILSVLKPFLKDKIRRRVKSMKATRNNNFSFIYLFRFIFMETTSTRSTSIYREIVFQQVSDKETLIDH